MCGIAFYGSHEIGDEVSAALILVFHLSPGLVDPLLLLHEGVVVAGGES